MDDSASSSRRPPNPASDAADGPADRAADQAGTPTGATRASFDEPFLNPPLDVSGLPPLEPQDYESLDPRYLRLRLLGDAIFAAIVVVSAVVSAFVVPWFWLPLAVGAGLLALTGLTAWLQVIEVRKIGYLVREQDFSFRSGVISHNVTTVPFARVQHVSIDRGPLARTFGLATLQIRTAGDGLTVPGLGSDEAGRLKALIVDRAGALAELEFADDDRSPERPGLDAAEL